jgi:hypothetical protein
LEEITGVNRVILLWASTAALCGFVFFGVGASLVSDVVGIVIPAFNSFLALESYESKKNADVGELKVWLQYWAVFGCFRLIEKFAGFLLIR